MELYRRQRTGAELEENTASKDLRLEQRPGGSERGMCAPLCSKRPQEERLLVQRPQSVHGLFESS